MVINGRPLSPTELNKQILAGLYYDLRHVFRFPAIRTETYWADLGLEQFYHNGKISQSSVSSVLIGNAINTRWTDLTPDKKLVVRGLQEKGYEKETVPSIPLRPGRYRFQNGHVEIAYLDGIYPHNLIGLDRNGQLCSMQVAGWSNNAGTTLRKLSELAAQVFMNAILLDNGGDVFFLRNNDPSGQRMIPYDRIGDGEWTLVRSCENRYTIRSVILFVADHKMGSNAVEAFQPKFRV